MRRLTTPDLMFGQMIAPPPSSSATKTCVSAEDVLKCFHDTGSPATSELSPIAVSARHTNTPLLPCIVHCSVTVHPPTTHIFKQPLELMACLFLLQNDMSDILKVHDPGGEWGGSTKTKLQHQFIYNNYILCMWMYNNSLKFHLFCC